MSNPEVETPAFVNVADFAEKQWNLGEPAKPRKPRRPYLTEKKLDEIRAAIAREAYNSGHADGWKECLKTQPNPLADFAVGVFLGAASVGALWWVF